MKIYKMNTNKKYIMPAILLLFLVLSAENLYAADMPDASADVGLMYNYWQSDKSDHGFQFATPIALGAFYKNFNMTALNAYVCTQVNPDSAPQASISAFLDTKLNVSYDMQDVIPVDILFGLGFNIPTGTTNLSNNQLVLVADPDLMPITDFGEGFNVNPYVSASKQIDRLILGAGFGYCYRGEYNFSETTQKLLPGDIITATVQAGYDITDEWEASIFGEYAYTGTDTVQGSDYYQEGDLWVIGLGGGYSQPSWEIDINLAAQIRTKSKFLTDAQILEPAAYNNHGIEYDAAVAYKYFLNDQTALGAGVGFTFIGKNSYPSDSQYYMGNRTKVSISGGIERTFLDNLKGNAALVLYTLNEQRDWEHPSGSVTYYGGTIAANISYTF